MEEHAPTSSPLWVYMYMYYCMFTQIKKRHPKSIALLTIDPLRWSGEWWCPSMLPDLLLSSSEVLLPSEVMSADTLLVRGVMLIDLSR